MSALLLALSVALAAPESYPMADAGITLILPKSWGGGEWSDWDFTAKSKEGTQLKVWTTPFQVPVNEASARAWAEMYVQTMQKEGFDDVKIERVAVEKIAGRPTARVQLSMRPRSGGPFQAVYHGAAFEGAAQVIHAYTISLARASERSQRDLLDVLEGLTVQKGPLALPDPQVSAKAGFGATLPEGWRAPLAEELPYVVKVTEKAGEDELDPARCWVGVRPPPVGDPDVVFACSSGLYLGPVDERSFPDEEPQVREKFFGKMEPPVAPAEAVQAGDRTAFYFRPAQGEKPVRLVVAPYGAGEIMTMWALSSHMDGPALDADLQRLLPTVVFTGEDGGKPQIGLDRWIGYYLKHRFFSPVVLGPLLVVLGIVALIARALTRKPAPTEP